MDVTLSQLLRLLIDSMTDWLIKIVQKDFMPERKVLYLL